MTFAVAGAIKSKIGAIRQLDMTGSPIFLFVKETRHYRILRKRLQRQRRDEFGCVICHHRQKHCDLCFTSKLASSADL